MTTGLTDAGARHDVAAIRAFMSERDPEGRLGVCGIREIVIDDDALASVVERARALVRGANGRPRCVLLVDNIPIRRRGEDVKTAVEQGLAEYFDVERVVLDDGHPTLHAADAILDEATAGVEGADLVVAVGGGTISDIAKWGCSRAQHRPALLLVQTAASVDGFTDDVSVVLVEGVKRTLPTCWPDVVVADLAVVAEAPERLNRAGFGETCSMLTAPADWLLAHVLGLDPSYHEGPVALLERAGEGIDAWSAGLPGADLESVRRLLQALAVRGVTTGTAGSTAVLSGVEHLVSHMLDLHHGERHEPIGLHGEQVGVATLVASAAWELLFTRMGETDGSRWARPLPAQDETVWQHRVGEAFDPLDPTGRVSGECWTGFHRKLSTWTTQEMTVRQALTDWSTHAPRLRAQVETVDRLATALVAAGSVASFDGLTPSVDGDLRRWAVGRCALMRNRFTVVDLLTFLGWWSADDVEWVVHRAESAVALATSSTTRKAIG